MPPLASNLRKQLENVVVQARDLTEAAARAALKRWAVDAAEPFAHFSAADKAFRNRLRARGRQAGDRRDERKGTQEIDQVAEDLAYEYWHRMLFARFLAENNLLMHPEGVPVTLAECEELARTEPASNAFVLAAKYASRMLPEIFRIDDVLLEVEFPINDRLPLEKLLASLPVAVFTADDSLGWVYQFWQTKKKDEVNKSGQKIDGRTLPAVTQLFTEHYMVEFLLHNTIGAWWCARNGITGPPGGAGVPQSGYPVRLDYLRWNADGTPAAGAFEGWPGTLKAFTMLEPCCGSGHFLVAAFQLLVPLRRHDERLSTADAVDAVLRENLHGLELDPRCTQIAAFALGLAAWKFPGEDGTPLGYRPLPPLSIACSGQGVVGSKDDWTRFANGDGKFREGMERLFDLFQKAPTLGSLIDPRSVTQDLFALGFDTLKGTLDRALKKIGTQTDPDRMAVGVAAQGIALAASLMAREFTLVATNVPYLARGKQAGKVRDDEPDGLRDYLEKNFPLGKTDLATAFIERCLDYCASGGSVAIISPQNWWFLSSYTRFRTRMLSAMTWRLTAILGEEAWQTFGIRGPKTTLLIANNSTPPFNGTFHGIDAAPPMTIEGKAKELCIGALLLIDQAGQTTNPDSRIIFDQIYQCGNIDSIGCMYKGISSGDYLRFGRCFWEVGIPSHVWTFQQSTVDSTTEFGGKEHVFRWENGAGEFFDFVCERLGSTGTALWIRGREAWGKRGISIGIMRNMPVSLYEGNLFDNNVAVIIPNDLSHLPALWTYCSSQEFRQAVRLLNKKLSVTDNTIIKVPFDLGHWQGIADEKYPNGLPEPHSDDPTQWLLKGHPRGSTDPLQVAVARLLGYRWPDQEPDELDALTDKDGIVPIPAVRGEPPAAERLREMLRPGISATDEHGLNTVQKYFNPLSLSVFNPCSSVASFDPWPLLQGSGAKPGTTLDDWLRNAFFEQHCKRFHHRPFIWHLWDGRKDGFACLVNYHTLDHTRLETLTYSSSRTGSTPMLPTRRVARPGPTSA